MPSKCFVSGCRSNYCSEPKVRVFSFPRDEILKNQWLQAIQREDKRQPSKASKICALHFKAEDIITEASGFNSKTQEFITVALQKHRLKPDAVPSIFNNLPRTRKKTWKKISRKTHDRSNIQLLEGSQECFPNSGPSMQSRHSRSSSDVSKYSDESPTKKTQASPTTDKPFITVIKPEDSRLGEPTSPEALGEDSSSCSEVLNSSNKSSPNTKTNPNSLLSPYKNFPSVSVW
ncbi:THAP domain-containing protein 2 [Trichonephila clavata]|uniref:THAP domain-containing protein 2 n=1 Tax=Trichonephila clavata TaxID=2740835 RepID=A0A8X6J7X5_TRICU|nr:THAP domain-containing protein 2 [Trichonephila clavata]